MRCTCRQLFYERLPGKKVLEIGCGPGTDNYYLHQMGLDVTATDFSTEFVQIVKNRYPYLTVHQMDMTQPDLPEINLVVFIVLFVLGLVVQATQFQKEEQSSRD